MTDDEKRGVIQRAIDGGLALKGFQLSAILEDEMRRESKFECDYRAAKMLLKQPMMAGYKIKSYLRSREQQ